ARREAQKLRFGPWLVSAVSSGNYRGLRWTDPTRSAFRVPWKHNARKDVTSSDLEVFKVGGLGVTGGELGGPHAHTPAPPGLGKGEWAWKTNFRCALRSTRMFVLLEDRSKCGDDPHKVF
ncbi:IRF3 factor, partial [Cochlearius cochlearius]|nr:IRF3 factor [Cochlearius cochlearius]